ncbi:hypothetical protein Pla175_43600 [Pirellulimonas nuda]|uniref:Uncharacterized protein n=1 Tax=Pirellulimonas nuda TaxID=2528009 RepID=A0A518DHJ4_9BACT|nr:hypothetical protein Pla175_43600 [Pirellulimonas nuda]
MPFVRGRFQARYGWARQDRHECRSILRAGGCISRGGRGARLSPRGGHHLPQIRRPRRSPSRTIRLGGCFRPEAAAVLETSVVAPTHRGGAAGPFKAVLATRPARGCGSVTAGSLWGGKAMAFPGPHRGPLSTAGLPGAATPGPKGPNPAHRRVASSGWRGPGGPGPGPPPRPNGSGEFHGGLPSRDFSSKIVASSSAGPRRGANGSRARDGVNPKPLTAKTTSRRLPPALGRTPAVYWP